MMVCSEVGLLCSEVVDMCIDISIYLAFFGLKEQNHEWERFKESSDYIAFNISRN